MLQIYLPGWGGSHTDYKTNLSSQLDWTWTWLELSLATISTVKASTTRTRTTQTKPTTTSTRTTTTMANTTTTTKQQQNQQHQNNFYLLWHNQNWTQFFPTILLYCMLKIVQSYSDQIWIEQNIAKTSTTKVIVKAHEYILILGCGDRPRKGLPSKDWSFNQNYFEPTFFWTNIFFLL